MRESSIAARNDEEISLELWKALPPVPSAQWTQKRQGPHGGPSGVMVNCLEKLEEQVQAQLQKARAANGVLNDP